MAATIEPSKNVELAPGADDRAHGDDAPEVVAADMPRTPLVYYRRTLLKPERVRALSQRRSARVLRDTALCWAVIIAAWAGAAWIHTWWAILLAIVIVGNRYYSLFIIGHDGMHRRLFDDMGRNDLFTDVFVLGPILSINTMNNRNHMRHHQYLGSEDDPDRHKHACFNKATRPQLAGYLTGLSSIFKSVAHVFRGDAKARAEGTAPTKSGKGYRLRDVAVLLACQAVLITTLTLLFGWWGYIVMWWVPVFVFSIMADNLRTFAEHSHPESDAAADQHRLVTNYPSRIERVFLSPMNMNYHAAHHLWPSIPYYNLPAADAEMRQSEGADAITWRGSYLAYLVRYSRALPLADCRPSATRG